MHYPIRDPRDWSAVGRLSPFQKVTLAYRNARYRRRAKKWGSVDLTRINAARPDPGADDIILICVVKDAETYLRSLLRHYRRLGVVRFAFVDDQSSDGTRALLLAQDDVDLYRSETDYRGSAGGLLWRDRVVEIYGRDRWYVSINADEYLVFPNSEHRPLADFVDELARNGLKRSLAVMLDMYPDGEIGTAKATVSSDTFPAAISPLHDQTDYRIVNEKFCTAIRGGPR